MEEPDISYGCNSAAFSTWNRILVVEVKDGSMSELFAGKQALVVGQDVIVLFETSAISLELSDGSCVIARGLVTNDGLRQSGYCGEGQDSP